MNPVKKLPGKPLTELFLTGVALIKLLLVKMCIPWVALLLLSIVTLLSIVAGAVISSRAALAQFNPDILSQSMARIVVKSKGKVVSVASGFVWQSPDQVVTSLHVLDTDPNITIIVEYGRKRRKAKIKSLLPEADLVLLEVSRANLEWQPLTTFAQRAPEYQSRLTALGFNKGALGMSTRELVKGYARPEVLAKLLPARAARILKKTNMPSVELPIYYLDGSLLPGYSGSPVVNTQGQLIGIGNGGLESGASSVSWAIPATNLRGLTASKITTIPPLFEESKQLFSSDRSDMADQQSLWWREKNESRLPIMLVRLNILKHHWWQRLIPLVHADNQADIATDLNWQLPDFQFREVAYQQFRFVRVKTRSFAQMLNSSGKPESLEHTLALFRHLFPGFQIAWQQMRFDVYTDAHYGLNLIVPKGALLTADQGFLLVQGALFCQLCPFEIQYHARRLTRATQQQINLSATEYLSDIAAQHRIELNQEGDYQEYRGFREIDDYGSGRSILRAAYSDFNEPFKAVHKLNYFVAANNRDAWFQVQGIISVFDQYFFEDLQDYAGTDCTAKSLSHHKVTLCKQIESAFQVLASVHFTSFSNRLF